MKKDHIKLDIPQYIDNPHFVTKKVEIISYNF